jgi:hypothetical protein
LTLRQIAKFSAKDAEAWPKYLAMLDDVCNLAIFHRICLPRGILRCRLLMLCAK